MEHPNLDVFRKAFAAFAAGDSETLAEVFDEQVVWHYPGSNQLSGNHVGREATFAMFASEFRLTNGTLKPDLHDALASDDHVVALLRTSAQRDEKTLDQNLVLIFHINDDKITEAWTVWTDAAAADAFWGQRG